MLHRGRSIPLKNVFATCGLILFLVGIGLGGYLIFCFLESSTLNRSITYNTCPPLQMCSLSTDQLNLETSSTLIRDSDTVHITAHFSTDQEAILSLTAPSFTVNPSEPMLVKPTTTKLDWILSPTKIGTFGIEVKMTDISGHTLLTEQKGIAVVNVLGMNPWQSKILSYAATFLGSMLSSPWFTMFAVS